MTDADSVGIPRQRAIARVRALVEKPLEEVSAAGYVIGLPVGEIVDAVLAEFADAALRLPRYYPVDEWQPWLLGTARRVDPDTGTAWNMYVRWRTGLPQGRIHVQIVESASTPTADAQGLDLAEFVASPEPFAHVLRAMLAACEHSTAQAAAQASAGGAE